MEKASTGPGSVSVFSEPTTNSNEKSSHESLSDVTPVNDPSCPTRLDPIGTSLPNKKCCGGLLQKSGLFVILACKRWDCPDCCKRKAKKLFARAKAAGNFDRLNRLATLPFKIGKERTWEQAIADSGPTLNRFLQSLRKLGIHLNYFWVREVGRKSNMMHYHMLLDRYLPKKLLSSLWNQAGGGYVVDIGIARKGMSYLWKYLLKVPEYPVEVQRALYRKRRYGTSKGLLAPLVPNSGIWVGAHYVCVWQAQRLIWRLRKEQDHEGNVFYTLNPG